MLAFIAADLAHEVVGHGIGLLLAGGRAGTFTTTKLISATRLPAPFWRIFDLAGPIGNLTWAALCLALQRLTRQAAPRWRLFLWAGAMFALFWELGYLMKCGLSGEGDTMALIEGLKAAGWWRTILFLTDLFFYCGGIRLLAADLHFVVRAGETEWRPRLRRLLWTLYLAGGLTACAGAVFDPRGRGEIFRSAAATSFIACLGLSPVARLFPRYRDKSFSNIHFLEKNIPLVVFAAVIFLLFVLVLGPGIPVSF